MKFYYLIILFLFSFFVSLAQTDTNRVNQRQIEIEESLENLQKGLENFQLQIAYKQAQIDKWADSIQILTVQTNNTANTNHQKIIDSLKNKISDNEDIIIALNDGIKDITETIIELNDEISNLNYSDTTYTPEKNTNNITYDDFNSEDYNFRRKKKFRGHLFGFNLSINSYVANDYSFNYQEQDFFMDLQINKSWAFNLNFIQYSLPFFNRYVGAVTGLGLNYNNYELIQNVKLGVDSNSVLNYKLYEFDLKKNRFKTSSITIPLIIEFHIPVNNKDKRLYFSIGVIGSYIFNTKMKIKYDNNGSLIKFTDRSSDFRETKFNYSGTFRVGYRNLYLFANYSIKPLFEQNYGPQLYPVTAGIGFCL
ncbi:MAG: outer membrane beta-barrel protein [Bacteroidales bacterium]|nr:outer membrane beta-barrel protein [Bacteroidales bacterium]